MIVAIKIPIYGYIVAAFILALIIVLIIVLTQFKKKEEPVVTFDFSHLLEALGGRDNIIECSNVQKRVKVILKNVKNVSAKALRELEIAAFLKQNELTFIYKDNVEELTKYLGSGE